MNFLNNIINEGQQERVEKTDEVFLHELQAIKDKVEKKNLNIVESAIMGVTGEKNWVIAQDAFSTLIEICKENGIEVSDGIKSRFGYEEREAGEKKEKREKRIAQRMAILNDLKGWGINLGEKFSPNDVSVENWGTGMLKIEINSNFDAVLADIRKFPGEGCRWYKGLHAWLVSEEYAQHAHIWLRTKQSKT